MAWLSHFVVRILQRINGRGSHRASHLAVGKYGETEAYFYLKNLGYRFVATNFRIPGDRGEIDLIGWDQDVLCFVEVKTRNDATFAPPSAAVTASKRQHIMSVARRYLRRLSGDRPSCRFDTLGVVPSGDGSPPEFSLHKGAFTWDGHRKRRPSYREFSERRFWGASYRK